MPTEKVAGSQVAVPKRSQPALSVRYAYHLMRAQKTDGLSIFAVESALLFLRAVKKVVVIQSVRTNFALQIDHCFDLDELLLVQLNVA